MSHIRRIPYTEMVERLQGEIVRDKAQDSKSEKKYKGVLNDVYMDAILVLPEDALRKTGTLTTIADYSEGLITVTAAGASVTGDSDAVWTSANSNDGLLKADDEDGVYRVAYSSATSLTLSLPSTWTDDAVTDGGYRLLFDRYALASDFSHMVEDNIKEPEVVYYYTGGNRVHLDPNDNGEFERDFMFTYSIPSRYTVKWIDGDEPYMYIWPMDDSARSLFYEYIPQLQPLKEYTTGTVTITKDATAVTGDSTLWGDFIDTTVNDYYYRTDSHGTGQASVWYKVSSVTDDTNLVLGTASLAEATAGSAHTISMVPKWPAKYDTAIMYAAAMRIDPNNQDAKKWGSIVEGLIPGWNKKFHKRITGRIGAQDLSNYF